MIPFYNVGGVGAHEQDLCSMQKDIEGVNNLYVS